MATTEIIEIGSNYLSGYKSKNSTTWQDGTNSFSPRQGCWTDYNTMGVIWFDNNYKNKIITEIKFKATYSGGTYNGEDEKTVFLYKYTSIETLYTPNEELGNFTIKPNKDD